MFTKSQITEIYCIVDEFVLEFKKMNDQYAIGNHAKRQTIMSTTEVMTIIILFHLSDFRHFKSFYINFVQEYLIHEFPNTVSYNRFVELKKQVVVPLVIFAKTCCLGQCTGTSFVDSTPIRVCKNKRIFNHKVFNGIATRGKSTMGYFYGFKLHLIINEIGQILDFQITQANVDDRQPLKGGSFLKRISGKLYGDKGYVSKELTQHLHLKGIHFITGIRKNMKNILLNYMDKILLRKRSIIETVNGQLKNICMIEHSRHRSFHNFLNNIVSGIIAYSFLPKKPTIKFYKSNPVNPFQLSLF